MKVRPTLTVIVMMHVAPNPVAPNAVMAAALGDMPATSGSQAGERAPRHGRKRSVWRRPAVGSSPCLCSLSHARRAASKHAEGGHCRLGQGAPQTRSLSVLLMGIWTCTTWASDVEVMPQYVPFSIPEAFAFHPVPATCR